MNILTENIVLSRAKAPDLNSVKKLNCWGSNLSDVSIVRRMGCVEVLSLSVNNISTLVDFSYCHNLQELYLRKNNILDLREICFLKCLPHLQSLWLADNPCAEQHNYRLTVLRALPNLKRLDNILVSSEELAQAAVSGDNLKDPYETPNVIFETKAVSPLPLFKSPEISTVMPHISKQNNFGIADEQVDLHSTSLQTLIPDIFSHRHDTNDHNFTSDVSPVVSNNNSVKKIKPSQLPCEKACARHAFQARVQTMVDHPDCGDEYYNCEREKNLFDNVYMEVHGPKNSTTQFTNDPDDTASTGDGYLQILKRSGYHVAEEEFEEKVLQKKQASTFEQNFTNRSFRKMNSNILSAVLCLVKELDFSSLQVVKAAVHCRMDEMSD